MTVNIEEFAAPKEELNMKEFSEKAEQAALMKHELAELKARTVELGKEFKRLCADLCDMMLEAGQDNIGVSGLLIKPDFGNEYFKAAGVTEEELFGYLERCDLADIIKPTVHYKSLNSSMRMFVEQGGELDPAVINESPFKKVAIRNLPKFLEAKGLS